MFYSSFSLSTVNINKCINHSLKILWSIHSHYFIFDSVFEFLIVLWCESLIISLYEYHNLLKLCWVLNHWFILSQNINTLFCCSFLINYLKNLLKFFFELFIIIKYWFLVFILFLDCLVKKLMQFEINSIEDCILEQEHSVELLVYFEFEFFMIEFNI